MKTPAHKDLVVSSEALSRLIADEWQSQENEVNPSTMPITRLLNNMLDRVAVDSKPVFEKILCFVETDMLFYRADKPQKLVEKQARYWDPLINWAAKSLGANFVLSKGIIYKKQSSEAIEAFAVALKKYDTPTMLTCLQTMVSLTGSALLSLALIEGTITVSKAWKIAHLDEDWTNEYWGQDGEETQRREYYFRDMNAAFTVLSMLK